LTASRWERKRTRARKQKQKEESQKNHEKGFFSLSLKKKITLVYVLRLSPRLDVVAKQMEGRDRWKPRGIHIIHGILHWLSGS
jgi:hypothetical protein